MSPNGVPTFTSNAHALTAKLNSGADKIEDPRGFLETVRTFLVEQEVDVWATEGAALKDAWKAAVRPDLKTNSELLVASGALKHSMTDMNAGRIRGATLRMHPKPYYAHFHQFGTVKMDARWFSGVSDATSRRIVDLYEQLTGEYLSA